MSTITVTLSDTTVNTLIEEGDYEALRICGYVVITGDHYISNEEGEIVGVGTSDAYWGDMSSLLPAGVVGITGVDRRAASWGDDEHLVIVYQ